MKKVIPWPERFWRKVAILENGCWEWTAGKNGSGYGAFYPLNGNRKQVTSHVWAYVQYVGPVPSGLELDHKCRNRACVNPMHLEPVTSAVNVLRGFGPMAINARKTHCKRGHLLSGENLRVVKDGRCCKTCARMHKARYRKARVT